MIRAVFFGVMLATASPVLAGPTQDLYEIRASGLVEDTGAYGPPPPIFADAQVGQAWSYSFLYDASVPPVNGRILSVVSFSISLEDETLTVDDFPVGNAYITWSNFGGQDLVRLVAVTNTPALAVWSEFDFIAAPGALLDQLIANGYFDPAAATSTSFGVSTNSARFFSGSAITVSVTQIPAPGSLFSIGIVCLATARRRR